MTKAAVTNDSAGSSLVARALAPTALIQLLNKEALSGRAVTL